MKTWQYHRGEWTEIDNPLPMPNGADWGTEMQRAGFEKWDVVGGEEYYASIEIWRRLTDTERSPVFKYFTLYSLGGDGFEDIWMTDLPSLLQFVREYAPVIQAQTQLTLEIARQSALEKAFQIWHEHSLDNICRTCDPFAYSLRENERRRRREEKRQEEEAAARGVKQ